MVRSKWVSMKARNDALSFFVSAHGNEPKMTRCRTEPERVNGTKFTNRSKESFFVGGSHTSNVDFTAGLFWCGCTVAMIIVKLIVSSRRVISFIMTDSITFVVGIF